jgi:ABC-type sugar transport system ATPase subunit
MTVSDDTLRCFAMRGIVKEFPGVHALDGAARG